MTAEQYERILRAALNMKRSKFAMAEALALDIPKQPNGSDGSVKAALEEVADQIVDMGGDEVAVATLKAYRLTAFWVSGPSGGTTFDWRAGSSFDAHKRAMQGGMDYAEFARSPRSSRDIQRMLGQKMPSGQDKTVEEMTTSERVDMARALAEAEPDMVTEAVVTKQKENVTKAMKKTPTPQHKNPSSSLELTNQWNNLRQVIGGNVRFTELITQGWARELGELGGFVSDEQRGLVEADVNKAIAVYERFLEDLNG